MHRLFWYVFCFLALVSLSVSEQQIKWIPNESEEASTSLPLSMNQRLQLKELEAAIQSSPDPEGTLTKVADANGLSPQDLVNMINKNSRDLDENPSLAQPTTIPRAAMKAFASISIIISQSARRRPRFFAVVTISLLFLLYASVVIPRTGLHLSKGRSLMSRGPTCLFDPPKSYLQRLADTPGSKSSVSVQTKKIKWDDLALEKDGVEAHSLPRKSTLRQAVSAQQSLSPDSLVDAFYTEDDDEVDIDIQRGEILSLLFESTAKLLSNREFAEFPTEARKLRVAFSSDSQKHGIIVVPGLGNFGRFGLVHWQVTHQMESDNQSSLTLTTVKGKGFFDGQLHIQIERLDSKVLVTTHLAVPKNGRKISQRIAMEIVEGMTESIVSSATQRSKQTLARTMQGKRFKSASHRRAGERRGQRHLREKLIEEMSEDRRRKWQRQNPEGGRWRPSGKRLMSPNNG
jgi:hypothetical protein